MDSNLDMTKAASNAIVSEGNAALDENQLAKLTEIFRTIFNDPNLDLSKGLTADDIPAWDSFAHINLIFAIEEAFEVHFSTKDINSAMDVDQLKTIVAGMLKGA
jgi:acyl carrier protein